MVPDFDSKHEIVLFESRQIEWYGIDCIIGCSNRSYTDLVKSVEEFSIKCRNKSPYDDDRYHSTKEGSVLRLIFIPQQLIGMEEIGFVKNFFKVSK